jgi:hypothetical protein
LRQLGTGEVDAAAVVDPGHEGAVERVERLAVELALTQAEGEQRELRFGEDLDAGDGADLVA